MARDLTIADGQLAASSTLIFSGADAPNGGRVNVVLSNTSTAAQTIVLTFQRSSTGTQRRIARAVLRADWQMILRNLPLQADDALYGYSSDTSVVDYLVTKDDSGPFEIVVLDSTGAVAGTTTGTQVVSGTLGIAGASTTETLLETQNDVLNRMLIALELLVGTEIPSPA